jgi:hypothetical protein
MSDLEGVAKGVLHTFETWWKLSIVICTIMFGLWLGNGQIETGQQLAALTTQIAQMEKKLDQSYTQTDAAKDQQVFQEQLKGIDWRIQRLEAAGPKGR